MQITLFVTDPNDIPALAETLRRYEKAKGARVNIRKSKAMTAGAWNTTVNMMNIPYCKEMTILAFQFSSTVDQSGKSSWTRVAGHVSEMYGRDVCLIQRIQYVHTFLLAKIRHIAQIFPI